MRRFLFFLVASYSCDKQLHDVASERLRSEPQTLATRTAHNSCKINEGRVLTFSDGRSEAWKPDIKCTSHPNKRGSNFLILVDKWVQLVQWRHQSEFNGDPQTAVHWACFIWCDPRLITHSILSRSHELLTQCLCYKSWRHDGTGARRLSRAIIWSATSHNVWFVSYLRCRVGFYGWWIKSETNCLWNGGQRWAK